MADAPYVTGNDLLAYQGNANLGYGGGTNYLYNPAIANPLQTFDNTLSQAAQNAQRMNEMVFEAKRREREMRYEQNVKERNAMLDMIHSTGQSIFNQKDAQGNNMSYAMLPEDYNQLSELNGQIAKEIAANPATANFAYTPEIREKYAKWQQLNNMAQQKAFMAQQTRMQMAQETDPEERQAIAEHLKSIEETPLGSFKHIEPYVSPLRYSYANIYDPKMYDKERQTELKKIQEPDANGNLVEKTVVGVSPSFGDFREKMKNDKGYRNNIYKMVEARLPTLSDAQVMHYDQLAEQSNATRGLKEGDTGYIPKLSEALQSGNREDIAYSLLGSPIMSTFSKVETKKDASAVKKEELGNLATEWGIEKTKEEIKKLRTSADKPQAEWEANAKLHEANALEKINRLDEELSIPFKGVALTVPGKDGAEEKTINAKWKDIIPVDQRSDKTLFKNLAASGLNMAGYRPVNISPNKMILDAAPDVTVYSKDGKPESKKLPPKKVMMFIPPNGSKWESKIVYEIPTNEEGEVAYGVTTPYDMMLQSADKDERPYIEKHFGKRGDVVPRQPESPAQKTQPVISKQKTINGVNYGLTSTGKWVKIVS